MNYYSHHIGDFNNATRHLTRIERSLYRDLIEMYYDTERPIQANDFDRLARRLLVATEDEIGSLKYVLSEFFTLSDNSYINFRCDKEISIYRAKADIARTNGKLGGRPKKLIETESEPRITQPVNLANPAKSESKANQEPITNNQEPITNNNKQLSSKHDNVPNEIFEYWCEAMNKNPKQVKLTAKRKKVIMARLKDGYPGDDIKRAILNCSQSLWHMGQNERNTAYNDIELICRSGEKLEGFRDSMNQPMVAQQTSAVTKQNIETLKGWIDG